ncbi:formate dehydrogenase accessory sulfurtransferase FdhD [Miniphocaeibacter halophilus]|uniref:Formate dehydrogenase accessory sulfurtransferase FdhD n=1 Tax=Miniphocaeibacter halophilus TaxID=2931922 RepID=A0AC61MNG1_9FIRM|nr:formate dehydrogenase accessory sulfurtransferase FdhD [Miniphocaeibacter halophilus]QQK07089.1 formate dehydrogenase accessory sulfurtransferase FdhD [Miniphocaeibacter halophilus]
MKEKFLNYEVYTFNNGVFEKNIENIVEESKIDIFINDKKIFKIVCSPFNLKEMAVGFLWMNGYINSKDDVISIDIDTEGIMDLKIKGSTEEKQIELEKNDSNIEILSTEIPKQIKLMEDKAKLFEKTGGVHCAALISNNEVIVYMEDIGRHNTLDKIAGYCILNNIDMSNKIIAFSGRLPIEIVTKISKMKVPIMISRSAPTNLGIELAREKGITLCGFTRNNRYHIYANSYRVKDN